jgi:iron complex outermembrane recepter protein
MSARKLYSAPGEPGQKPLKGSHACLLLCLLFFLPYILTAQTVYKLNGHVVDHNSQPIAGAYVYNQDSKQVQLTEDNGGFEFVGLLPGTYRLHVSYLGYKCIHPYKVALMQENQSIVVVMEPEQYPLDEVEVQGKKPGDNAKDGPEAVAVANRKLMDENRDHSLVKTLESLPGLQAMEIGQGSSKPIIRGLGFNRVVVAENNTKIEGQQWGADHGLEIDQYAVEQVEVVKGPASLRYGSEAIGGVLRILPLAIAANNSLEANLQLTGRSLNNLVAASAMIRMRKASYFNNIRFTISDFGVYRVPATEFIYNSYRFPLLDGAILNSGGHERNLHLTNGLIRPWGKLTLSLSNLSNKTGFFLGAHGIPDLEELQTTPVSRKPGLPFQQVNHLKVNSHALLDFRFFMLDLDMAWQRNHRQEWSRFHTHYPNQLPPEKDSELELDWVLDTYSVEARLKSGEAGNRSELGLSFQHQNNDIGGYMFLLPAFSRSLAGIFFYKSMDIGQRINLSGGLRYDWGRMQIMPYFSPYTQTLKAPDFTGFYHDFSWAVGMTYAMAAPFKLKINAAKSFRVPNAAELGANGVHHGSFRYELGDTGLDSEKAYQFDLGLAYHTEKLQLALGPFFSYFPNFIFLNPTGSYSLPDGSPVPESGVGQVFAYVQSQAWRAGGELMFDYMFGSGFSARLSAEYVLATDGKYAIPLTPPLGLLAGLKYALPDYWKSLHQSSVQIDMRYAAPQNRNARNEEKTAGYSLLNIGFSTKVLVAETYIGVQLKVQNLLNTVYWNHLSYYRQIGLPEAGRNVQLTLNIPFNTQLKHGK